MHGGKREGAGRKTGAKQRANCTDPGHIREAGRSGHSARIVMDGENAGATFIVHIRAWVRSGAVDAEQPVQP